MFLLAKSKISATVTPELLERAQRITGISNVSRLIDEGLEALIELHLEQRWMARSSEGDLPGEVPVDLSDLPWEE